MAWDGYSPFHQRSPWESRGPILLTANPDERDEAGQRDLDDLAVRLHELWLGIQRYRQENSLVATMMLPFSLLDAEHQNLDDFNRFLDIIYQNWKGLTGTSSTSIDLAPSEHTGAFNAVRSATTSWVDTVQGNGTSSIFGRSGTFQARALAYNHPPATYQCYRVGFIWDGCPQTETLLSVTLSTPFTISGIAGAASVTLYDSEPDMTGITNPDLTGQTTPVYQTMYGSASGAQVVSGATTFTPGTFWRSETYLTAGVRIGQDVDETGVGVGSDFSADFVIATMPTATVVYGTTSNVDPVRPLLLGSLGNRDRDELDLWTQHISRTLGNL